jgi:glyoxylate/hydroxypyruvate reductase
VTAFLFVTPTWDGKAWAAEMKRAAPQLEMRVWPDVGRLEDIHYVAAWLPPPHVVASLPNLKVIYSLGAGVDAILSDKTLPAHVPIVRVNDDDLTNRMSEYIVLHCLMHHRQLRKLDQQQREKNWHGFDQHAANAMTVGVMGLGVLGQDAAKKLAVMGFRVVGWSRTQKSIPGITCFAGEGALDSFLAETDILVSLLPATRETEGLINRTLIRKLSRKGPFGAPILINAGRGRQQVEADIITALDAGELHAATLDVFVNEPLPQSSPLWSHPKVTITPHNAADSEPAAICAYVAEEIARFERGEPLRNLVDLKRGY